MAAKRKARKGPGIAQPSQSRVSAREGKEARIREFGAMMASGKWVRGVTGPEYAARRSVSISTVERDAAEAWRRLCAARNDDPSEAASRKASFVAYIDHMKARAAVHDAVGEMAAAAKLEAEAFGFLQPARVEVTGDLSQLLATALEQGDGGDAGPPVA